MLENRKILIGVTGSIAAYKAAILIRLLVKEQASVKVIMTPLAKEFITPLTLAALSKNPVLVDFYNPENGEWNNHVDLGMWADAYIIAPATANTIAKMANGIADNLLLTAYLSARCPVFVVPAMDMDMLSHPATQRNIERLKQYGSIILEPETGELASGLIGKGRMEEPDRIVDALGQHFNLKKKILSRLKDKKILVTAGPTREPIDAVRFVSNYSSGKMGYAIAEKLAYYGAKITLVSGPSDEKPASAGIKLKKVKTAAEMHRECIKVFGLMDGAILVAAVADYRPRHPSNEKIKRSKEKLIIELAENPDIAASLGAMKKKHQFLAGFALETQHGTENAMKKLIKKNFDFIVLNSLQDRGAGFESDTNKITILDKHNRIIEFPLKSKQEVAEDIVQYLQTII
ncbi:MAG: bifunctional phosphopantothenoylcysteine decarboxylase/phosphopantothenate--cysteine ligase CoaBC [Bacteroidales bacterium]|nr:bifunctional phosphopantothenoylcysteine decarboxylase/phosphopantothenate--cysteine ligase CoaBC [Bacteroidales bacterium]MBN2761727.1 bifunctional phosphopantothenoylcysteine decarboxylase/phosphopantothenate--cysteine ligase CoaBC [Bacteroidales bacterium]